MDKIPANLLEDWKNKCISQGSIFQFKHPYNKKVVLDIYQILKENFPESFFQPRKIHEGTIMNGNWLHALLMQPENYGSFTAVKEFAYCVHYMIKYLPEETKNRFYSYLNELSGLRNTYFEVFTYRLLHQLNGINTAVTLNSTEKTPEGLCVINGKQYLFECKNSSMHGLEVLDRYLTPFHELFLQMRNIVRVNGILISLKLNPKAGGNAKQEALKKIRDFVSAYKTNTSLSMPYVASDENGILKVDNYDRTEEIALTLLPDQFHVMFRMRPPVIPDYERFPHETAIALNFFVPEKKVKKKLREMLSACKEHHIHPEGRIFFFNMEAVNDLIMPLYRLQTSFPDKFIQDYYKQNFNSEDALVFVFRDYTSDSPSISFKVYTDDLKLKSILENLKTGITNLPLRVSYFPPGFVKSIYDL